VRANDRLLFASMNRLLVLSLPKTWPEIFDPVCKWMFELEAATMAKKVGPVAEMEPELISVPNSTSVPTAVPDSLVAEMEPELVSVEYSTDAPIAKLDLLVAELDPEFVAWE